jgi:hypothetical protein
MIGVLIGELLLVGIVGISSLGLFLLHLKMIARAVTDYLN